MQLQTIVIAALAAVAAASPYEEKHGHGGDKDHGHGGGHGRQCKPATYQCAESHGKPAWNVCDTSGKWVFAGFCPPKTKCYFNEKNQSPYCI